MVASSGHRKIEVAAADVDRRVLRNRVAEEVGELGLITCFRSGIGQATRLPAASGCAWAVAPTSCFGCGRRR